MTDIPLTALRSHAHRFADELDSLVRLLADGPERVDEQKAILRALHETAAGGEVTILAPGEVLILNGVRAYDMATDPQGLFGRLAAHGVAYLHAASGAMAADLLAMARALAASPGDDGGPAALDLRTVRASRSIEAVDAAPAGELVVVADRGEVMLTPLFTPVVADGSHVVAERPAEGYLPAGAHTSARFGEVVGAARDAGDAALIARLREGDSVDELIPLLDEVVVRVEAATRDGDPQRVHAFLAAVVAREEVTTVQEVRIALNLALRALLTVSHLRLVATLLPRMPELRDDLYRVLGRAGEEGADAVIEHLAAAESSSDRRVYFNSLVRLQAGTPALMHMLGDPRWYVVRNAAELLGELDARGADEALERTLAHADERVRRAAATALGRLATARACHALRDALHDADPGVRSHVALALAGSGWPYAVATLRRALADEQDTDVRLALVTALGRAATDDAVDALAELAEAPRGLFRRRTTPIRTAAVRALADADTPRARDVLARLVKDRDPGVRGVAERVLKR